MNVEALVFKYSGNPDPEQMLRVCPVEDVIEVLKNRLRGEVHDEVSAEYESRISQLEDELYHSTDFESTSEQWESQAVGLYRAIDKAIKLPWSEALPILRKAMEDNGDDIEI